LTADHVPPKGIFPERVWSQLPTAHACEKRNAAWQKDSDYFRDYLLSGPLYLTKNESLADIRGNYDRALRHRAKAKRSPHVFPRRFMFRDTDGWAMVEDRFPLVLPTAPVFVVTLATAKRVAGIIGRTAAAIWAMNGNPSLNPQWGITTTDASREERARRVLQESGATLAKGLLRLWSGPLSENPLHREMLLSFYDDAIFIAVTHLMGKNPYSNILQKEIYPSAEGMQIVTLPPYRRYGRKSSRG
jgi:hypothetical protein